MITDPKTTPNTRGQRILFGLMIAIIDGWLRLANNQYSPFIALFIVAACFPLYQAMSDVIQTRRSVTGEMTNENKQEHTSVEIVEKV
jgi:Na+-translocating ferredoxin:NAD+ oxidoreductase RnfD subunit